MANFGETLRRERELRDISLREIADATKINLRYLEALEQNRFEILPGGVFNKGFIRAYARFIGADGETFVDSYLHEMAAREARGSGGGATLPAAGLHRPSESPKRRAVPDEPAQVAGQRGEGDSAGSTVTLTESAVRPGPTPASTSPPPHIVFLEAQASARAGARRGPSPLVLAGSVIGVGALVLIGFWLLRGSRPEEPGVPQDPVPASTPYPSDAVEDPLVADPAAATLPAIDDPTSAATETGGAGTDPAANPAANPARDAVPGQGSAEAPVVRGMEPSRRHDPVDRPADPERTMQDPGTMPRTQIASPLSPPLPSPAPRVDPSASGSMNFRIEATAPVWVQVACDGDDRLNRALQPGEGVTLRCLSFIRISVTDIGAVRLMVNGSRCAVPGERGSRIEGFVIRAEDATVICPRQQGATHGRD